MPQQSDKREVLVGWVCAIVVALLALAITANVPVATGEELTGVVVSSAVDASRFRAPVESAAVRLASGQVIMARVTSGGPATSGQIAHVHTQVRLISRQRVYEVYRLGASQ